MPASWKNSYKWRKLKNNYGDFANRIQTYFSRDADVFFISFPKSGRTWVRYMLTNYIEKVYSVKVTPDNIYPFTKQIANLPTISFSHDGSANQPVNLNKDDLATDMSFYLKDKKTVLLVRDPRDVVVSYFHHSTARKKVFNGTISEFIRSDYWGIHKIIKFLNNWVPYLGHENLLIIKYEDLRQNDFNGFKQIINFLDLKYDELVLHEVVCMSKFDKMKNQIEKGEIESTILVPTNNDPNSAKVRKGVVEGYKKELSGADLDYVNLAIKQLNTIYAYN